MSHPLTRRSLVLRHALPAVLAAAALAGCGMMPSMASNTTRLAATLSGSAEVPPTTSGGSGNAEATFDRTTNKLSWKITYTGLSGPATAGHFHGPAMPGANAGVVLPFKGAVTSPIEGEAMLSAEQAADLLAGKWYANIHTAANPGGEIRGQLTPSP